ELFFTAMATRLDGARAATADPVTINFVFTDIGETHVLNLENAVLHHWKREADPAAAATIRLTRPLFLRLLGEDAGMTELLGSEEFAVEGSRTAILGLLSLLDGAEGDFPIVTP
ncbi:MAG: alkyl sulfatase C-terminal domain-containing protein, partial [Gammaproteobacteria bacterium]